MHFEARPPAKVNLALAMTGRRADGFHELSSVFVRIGLADRISVRLADPSADRDHLTITGDDTLPVDGNLVSRAVELLRGEARLPLPFLDLALEKRIPVAAGLGGGSADAAAALGLAATAWGIGLAPDREQALALALGADVPFFAGGHAAALVTGVGERLEPLPGVRGDAGLLIVTPPIALATRAVYRAYDGLSGSAPSAVAWRANEVVDALAKALRSGLEGSQLVTWSDRLAEANDLWPAALTIEPDLARVRSGLEHHLGRRLLMSGSGATLVGLYASAHEAADAGKVLISSRTAELDGSSIAACDLIGPDPTWRHP